MKIKYITTKMWSFCIICILFSCNTDTTELPENVQSIPEEVIKKVESLALNPQGMTLETFETPDGTTETVYMVEGDIAIYPEQLASMSIYDGITSEQYRTRNLVSQPRTLSVIGYTGGVNGLTANMQTGLTRAINNYNAIPGLTLNFTLTFATSTAADIVVFVDPSLTGIGAAGFPDGNGNPFKWIRLPPSSLPLNVIECIITHEIGHSIGLRHTDWFSRQSCGQNVNEGDLGVGAIHIPGTPTGFDPTSIMLACGCNSQTNGGFNANDITALQFLY